MTQYLISFDDGAMTFPEEELPDVAKAASAVVQEASIPRSATGSSSHSPRPTKPKPHPNCEPR
jgi:hypothetical protein